MVLTCAAGWQSRMRLRAWASVSGKSSCISPRSVPAVIFARPDPFPSCAPDPVPFPSCPPDLLLLLLLLLSTNRDGDKITVDRVRALGDVVPIEAQHRSEERRVGTEWRIRW